MEDKRIKQTRLAESEKIMTSEFRNFVWWFIKLVLRIALIPIILLSLILFIPTLGHSLKIIYFCELILAGISD